VEHVASVVGFYPYDCHACHHHFLQRRKADPPVKRSTDSRVEREIAATRAAGARRRKQRELLLYGLALLVFGAILYFLTREPRAGA